MKALETHEALRQFALTLPEAWEDFPWGETAIKVRKKIFVFLGSAEPPLGLSLKLPHSSAELLENSWATPTAYGLGRHGWVSLKLERGDELDLHQLRELVEESYRSVAPKTLARQLDI